jgi:hypothetical protein
MNDFLSILAAPVDTLEKIAARPRWLIPVLFCTMTFFLLLWLGGCWQNLSAGLTWSSLLGPALISPVIVGIVSLGSTAFVFLMNMILGGSADHRASFKTLFSVNVHCGIVFLLGEVINFLLVRSNLLGDLSFALPNRFPMGIDVFLLGANDPNLYLLVVLQSTSVFVVWYLIVLAKGVRFVTGSSKVRSSIIVTALWCVVVGFALGIVYSLGGGTTIHILI